MISTFFLSFREVFEAALLVGIVVTYLVRSGKNNLLKFAFSGTFAGLISSLVIGLVGYQQMKAAEGEAKEIFEAIMKLIAAALILYVTVWIEKQNRNISKNIKEAVDNRGTGIGLFSLAFVSVLREGMELVIFILANSEVHSSGLIVGILLGSVVAIGLTFAIFKFAVKVNIKMIFKLLGLVLIIIGAEMFGEGLMEIFKMEGELLEFLFLGVYLISMSLIFFKEDLKELFAKFS
jgi:high-affinity iron transporter